MTRSSGVGDAGVMRVSRLVTRIAIGVALCAAAPAISDAQQPRHETAALEQQLAATTGTARIPVLLELAARKRDQPGDVIRLADEAITLLALRPSVVDEVAARSARSYALQAQGDYPAALAEAQRAERAARMTRDDALLGEALHHVGLAEWRMARYSEALEHAEQARSLQSPRGDSVALVRTLNLIGGVHHSEGNLDAALESYLTALRASEAIGDEQSAARSHNNIGLVYWDLKRNQEALTALERALAIHERVGPLENLANTLNNVGMVLLELGRPLEGIPYLERALALDRESGNLFGQAKDLSNLGWAQQALHGPARAIAFHEQALALREHIGDKDGIVRTTGAIAAVRLERGETAAAIALHEQAIALAEEIGDRLDQIAQLEALAKAREVAGDSSGALAAYRRFHELQTTLDDERSKRHVAELEAHYRLREREHELAAAEQLAASRSTQLRWLWAGSGLLGGSLVLLGVLYTLRGRAQRALAESEQRYRALFQSSVVPTFLIESGTRRVLDLNDPARALCGGRSAATTQTIDTLEPQWIRQALCRALDTATVGEPLAVDDCASEPSGQTRWTEIRGSAVALSGRACRLVSIRDITKSRVQEEALQRDAKMQSLGALAGGIAHDFNNALTGIIGHVSLAREGEPHERAEMLDLAEKAALGARRLTNQLLAFARGGQPARRPTNTGRLLRDAVALAGAGSHMRVDYEIPDDLWPAHVDASQFSQVVSNLVVNAQQATAQGGRLVVRASNCQSAPVNGGTTDESRYVRIDFEDNGSGIADDIRGRVFDPYFTTKSGNNGLGLTTAFTICRNHGGALTFTSRVGEGTTFSAYFPAASEPVAEPAAPPAARPVGIGSILVLDDEPLVRNVLKRMLEQWGYTVETVADGRAAVERYAERLERGAPFDLLIMDLTIPGGMGGRQAITEILAIDPRARAVVASGYSDDPTMSQYREAGFIAALAKPFRKAELAQILEAAMPSPSAPS